MWVWDGKRSKFLILISPFSFLIFLFFFLSGNLYLSFFSFFDGKRGKAMYGTVRCGEVRKDKGRGYFVFFFFSFSFFFFSFSLLGARAGGGV